ncbi:MAG: peptidase S9 [Flavobacterium sp. BFFFF2]|nr:MAG: peptidase S9 [Flavobacterium sp. BFFFF2]
MCASLQAQLKTLSLDDAVLQQNKAFRPDKLMGVQWLPKQDAYVYYADTFTRIMKASPSQAQAVEYVNVTLVNQALGSSLKNLFGIQWMDADQFLVADGARWYQYTISKNKGTLVSTLPDQAENVHWNTAKTKIIFTLDNNLYLFDNGKQTAITSEPAGVVSGQTIARNEFGTDEGIFWSPNGQAVAFYQKDERAVADYPLLDITVTPGKADMIKYPMAGQSSEKPKVGIYDLQTGKLTYIEPELGIDAYLTNLAWTPDGNHLLIAELNRGQNEMHLNAFGAQSGKRIKTYWTETHAKWVEPEHPAYFLDQLSNDFVWISEKDGYMNAYKVDWKTGNSTQLTKNTCPIKKVLGVSDSKKLYFLATGPDPKNMWAYSINSKGKQRLITTDAGVHQLVYSDNGKYAIDEYSNPTTPSRTVLWSDNGSSKELLKSNDKLADYQLGKAEFLNVKAADGTTNLEARIIKPSNFDATKKYPVLVYVYGGPHAQLVTNSYLSGANLWMYWMAEQGYIIFTVDNRGSDNRGFAFENVIHRQLGIEEMRDQLKGIDYLKSLPYVDANRLAVHGWSFGGFMTTSLLLRYPEVFKVGVAGGPVTDWKWYEVMYGERYMDTPAENQAGYEEASTLKYVQNLKAKFLLIHGTSDDVVVMQHNFALLKKCIEAQKQLDFFPYPMHKHNVQGKDRAHLMRKVLEYILENNR